jgi:membrane protein
MNSVRLWVLARETIRKWWGDPVNLMASGLAFFFLLSLSPLLLLLMALVGRIFTDQQILRPFTHLANEQAFEAVSLWTERMHRSGHSAATLSSVVILFFAASGVFQQIRSGLHLVWKSPPPSTGIWRWVKHSILPVFLVAAFGALVLGFLMVDATFSVIRMSFVHYLPWLAQFGLWFIFQRILALTLLATFVAVVFKLLPPARVRWPDAWIGALVTTAGIALANKGLGIYFKTQAFRSAYGAAGLLAVFIIWVFVCAHAFFFGAETTYTCGKLRTDAWPAASN